MTSASGLSVVICGAGRRDALARALRALADQHGPLPAEVVVASTAGADPLREVGRASWPFPVDAVDAGAATTAAARNAGAARARSAVLVFLDEGLVPGPEAVGAHLRAHEAGRPRVVMGNIETHRIPPRNLFAAWVDLRNRDRIETIAAAGRRFRHGDVSAAHLSMRAETFRDLGGFDAALPARAGLELGARLLAAGVDLEFAPDATVSYGECPELRAWLARCADEGRADVMLLRSNGLLSPLVDRPEPPAWARAVRRSAFRTPAASRVLLMASSRVVPALDAIRQRSLEVRLLGALQFIAYWRGVASEVRDHHELLHLLGTASSVESGDDPTIDVDLGHGISVAEALLERERPRAARIRLGTHEVGELPRIPHGEGVRGRHLRPALAGEFAERLRAVLLDEAHPTNGEIAALRAVAQQAAALARPAVVADPGPAG